MYTYFVIVTRVTEIKIRYSIRVTTRERGTRDITGHLITVFGVTTLYSYLRTTDVVSAKVGHIGRFICLRRMNLLYRYQ